MKNPLAKIAKKEVIKVAVDKVMKPVYEHQGAFLTGTTIVCNTAAIILTYRNSPRIHTIISNTRSFAKYVEDEKEKKELYSQALKELTPLIAPILVLYAGSVAAPIINHKKTEAKIATLTAALSLAQTTISEYDSFKEEVRKEVGEEKYQQIKNEVTQQQVNQSTAAMPPLVPEMGDQLCYIPDWDIFFSSTEDKINIAFEHINTVLHNNGKDGKGYGATSHRGNEIVTYADLLRELRVKDVPLLADELVWEAGRTDHIQYWVGSGNRNGIPYLSIEIHTRPVSV